MQDDDAEGRHGTMRWTATVRGEDLLWAVSQKQERVSVQPIGQWFTAEEEDERIGGQGGGELANVADVAEVCYDVGR